MSAFFQLFVYFLSLFLAAAVRVILPVCGIVLGLVAAKRNRQPKWLILSGVCIVILIVSIALFFLHASAE